MDQYFKHTDRWGYSLIEISRVLTNINVSHNLSLFCDEEHVTMANPFYFTPQYKNTSFYIHASLTTFKTWLT